VAGVFFISSIHGLLALLVNHGYQCVGALRLYAFVVVLRFAAKDWLGLPRSAFHGLLASLVNHGYQCVGALRLDGIVVGLLFAAKDWIRLCGPLSTASSLRSSTMAINVSARCALIRPSAYRMQTVTVARLDSPVGH